MFYFYLMINADVNAMVIQAASTLIFTFNIFHWFS